MAAQHGISKKKLVIKTIAFGALTAAMYAAVFTHANAILEVFTRGGAYAALPIATVFAFSFIHGTFASNLWSTLGIDAIIKPATKRPEVRPAQRPAKRPRARLSINA